MSIALDQARERLHNQLLDATTLPEIAAAKQALRDWLKAHPEDEWLRDGFEQLSLMQDIAEEQEAERVRAISTPQQTGAVA